MSTWTDEQLDRMVRLRQHLDNPTRAIITIPTDRRMADGSPFGEAHSFDLTLDELILLVERGSEILLAIAKAHGEIEEEPAPTPRPGRRIRL